MGGIFVGSPPRKYNVIFDTGSANFWLYGKGSSDTMSSIVSHYDPKDSSTSSVPERCCRRHPCSDTEITGLCTWTVEYGGGGIKANVGADDVVIGTIPLKALEFGQVFETWGDFGDAEGIIGLAFPDLLGDNNTMPLLDAMIQAGQLKSADFAVYLSTNIETSVQGALASNFESEISFGLTKPHLHTAPFIYHQLLAERNYWAIEMLDFQIGGVSTVHTYMHVVNMHVYAHVYRSSVLIHLCAQ